VCPIKSDVLDSEPLWRTHPIAHAPLRESLIHSLPPTSAKVITRDENMEMESELYDIRIC
jgi:hypothetical protein